MRSTPQQGIRHFVSDQSGDSKVSAHYTRARPQSRGGAAEHPPRKFKGINFYLIFKGIFNGAPGAPGVIKIAPGAPGIKQN